MSDSEPQADIAPDTWYKEWFESEEYEIVYQKRNREEARRLIELLEREARPEPASSVLDMACGRGRHAVWLAQKGYRVTGIDLSPRAISRARLAAAEAGVDATFLVGDMREPVCSGCFDGVVNVFTAFGYFDGDADNQAALQAMAGSLRPGGWFLQDFLNAPQVQASLNPGDSRIEQGIEIEQRRWIEQGRVNKVILIRRNSDEYEYHESVRLYELRDFERMYSEVGLCIEQVFGDYRGAVWDPSSPRLILLSRKKAA